ncbi:MAG: tRNA preQ1(34) S-adenosylmethionine ribosyltransferase-isomerase QueA [Candidatus Helarchaeota archaeon]|nr:tRNA preQ1(34) S-adenosylmethionine ribosyltransferase-isomerase QueA [Candidatus Helarchaeota archaeon]
MIKLEDYDYILPKEKIAQHPAQKRDRSKLLVIIHNQIKHKHFYQIGDEIEKGDVIVVNNTKVISSILKGQKETGGKIEAVFLREIDPQSNEWECLLKGRKLRIGGKILFSNDQLMGTIIEWKKFGQFVVRFSSVKPVEEFLKERGVIALPPYIKAPQDDLSRYQTIYASQEGSIAAPTAGFHFTPELIQNIEKRGAKFVELTLHVGYSTFMPLNNEILLNHKMEPEYFIIPPDTIATIEECQHQNYRLIVIGTTTLKALESAVNNKGKITKVNGWSDLFITPNYSFKSDISRMVTNFHMPKSSPLLMVCAYAGKERIFNAYQEALSNNYRFYSFGDAMLIDRE